MWKIEHRAYRLPFRTVVRTAHGPWAAREGFLVRAVRREAGGAELGAVGWGEIAPIPWFGTETVEEAGSALAGLKGEAASLDEALVRVPAECGCVRAALAAAMGRGAGNGGALDEVFNHETHERYEKRRSEVTESGGVKFLAVAGLLPAGRGALEAVGSRLELGFRAFKWKVGVGAAADEWGILDDLLGEFPKGAKLRLDANGAWDRKVAEGWLARAAERPMIEYVEQPCFADAKEGAGRRRQMEDLLRGLAEDFPVAIALDESIAGAADVERWLAMDWRGVWVIKPTLLGDAERVLAKLAKARADVVFGSALDTCVGARSGLLTAFAWAEERAAAGGEKTRALGYGVYPLFEDARANVAWSGPFVRREDVERINPEALWNALS